jgi:hypothetical protein
MSDRLLTSKRFTSWDWFKQFAKKGGVGGRKSSRQRSERMWQSKSVSRITRTTKTHRIPQLYPRPRHPRTKSALQRPIVLPALTQYSTSPPTAPPLSEPTNPSSSQTRPICECKACARGACECDECGCEYDESHEE